MAGAGATAALAACVVRAEAGLLSLEQADILKALHDAVQRGVRPIWGGKNCPAYYQWKPASCGFGRCRQASISRSLRRLEARGLVCRGNHVSGEGTKHRTTCVRLTPAGAEVAAWLTKRAASFVNRDAADSGDADGYQTNIRPDV